MSKKVPSPRKPRDGASTNETRGASSPRGEGRSAAGAGRIGKSGAAGKGPKARAGGGGDPRKATSPTAAGVGAARGPSKSPQPTVRLQKVLAEAGVASRRRAEELILAGKVKVNGMVVRELGTKVDPTRDRVVVAGEIARSEPKVYYLLNKPDGIVCSAEGQTDDRGRPTVLSLLQGVHERIYPVGRLDFHTRGLLLLTNDGELADLLAHPRNKVLKIYHAKFQGRLDHAALDALAKGVVLDDGVKTKPAEISVIKDTDTNTWVEIGLRQGLNRQVRRMGEAIGHPVLKLIRVGLGDLDVDDLDEGQYRRLSRTEIETLRAYAQFGKEPGKEPGKEAAPPKPAAAKAAPTKPAATKPAATKPAPEGSRTADARSSSRSESGGEGSRASGRARAAGSPARSTDDRPARDRTSSSSGAQAKDRGTQRGGSAGSTRSPSTRSQARDDGGTGSAAGGRFGGARTRPQPAGATPPGAKPHAAPRDGSRAPNPNRGASAGSGRGARADRSTEAVPSARQAPAREAPARKPARKSADSSGRRSAEADYAGTNPAGRDRPGGSRGKRLRER